MRRPWTPIYEECAGTQVCRIPLSQGLFALIDAKYLGVVLGYAWFANYGGNTNYACTNIRLPDGSRRLLQLHKLIWELAGNAAGPVDHKNGDGLDCCSCNLRPGPQKLNIANCRKWSRATSSCFKGVSRYSASKWRVHIKVGRKKKHLGYFKAEAEAARAYDKAAFTAWGEYANLNFPAGRKIA